MSKQPEALRLADWLDVEACGGSNWNARMNAAAAELRRLHGVSEDLIESLNHKSYYQARLTKHMREMKVQRNELLSALQAMLTHMSMDEDEWNEPTFDQARAAVAKAQQ
jgi:hypothetical protein